MTRDQARCLSHDSLVAAYREAHREYFRDTTTWSTLNILRDECVARKVDPR